MSDMSDQEEIIKQKEKRKKTLILAVCIIAGMAVLLWLVTLILESVDNQTRNQRLEDEEKIFWAGPFPDPEDYYDYDIFTDTVYMTQTDRSVRIIDAELGIETVMTDENRNSYPLEIRFVSDALELVINGNHEEYNKIFTDEYLKTEGDNLREFTMQQLYNITLERIAYKEDGMIAYTDIKVYYNIRKNNGSFRTDLDFDASFTLPVVYMLVTDRRTGTVQVENVVRHIQYEPREH